MIELSVAQRHRLHELGVSLLYLFGSYAEGVATPLSDVDLGVAFVGRPPERSATYQPLYELATELFPGRTVDLAFLQQAPLELRGDVVRHGVVLYERAPGDRVAFEERTLLACADFAPTQRDMDRAILART